MNLFKGMLIFTVVLVTSFESSSATCIAQINHYFEKCTNCNSIYNYFHFALMSLVSDDYYNDTMAKQYITSLYQAVRFKPEKVVGPQIWCRDINTKPDGRKNEDAIKTCQDKFKNHGANYHSASAWLNYLYYYMRMDIALPHLELYKRYLLSKITFIGNAQLPEEFCRRYQ